MARVLQDKFLFYNISMFDLDAGEILDTMIQNGKT